MDGSGKGQKVYVGMSGGVDSSTAAVLLVEQGYDVTGVFIRVWQPDWLPCTWRRERQDAIRVAAQLGIPFKTLDLSEEYKKEVVDYMISEYKIGRTPNPDVMCNKYIKFGGFFDWAMSEGADYVATGHYSQVKKKNEDVRLYAGADKNKDQSYFLWTITQKQLSKTLFPVGGMQKDEVRKTAERFGLATAGKKDSQGLCFIGKVNMREFLKHYIDSKSGDVLNLKGDVIGVHDGVVFYTIGQRHGFDIKTKSKDEPPKYIVSKDLETNTITVVSDYKEKQNLGVSKVIINNTNWVDEIPIGVCEGRIRYRQPLQECSIGGEVITFAEPQHGVAIGQSVVLYKGGECLGGGIVESIE